MKAILNFSNNRISRSNSLLTGLIPLVLVFILACSKAKTPPTQAPIDPNALVLSGPPASVSFPLAYMVATGALKDAAPSVVFKMWMTPDQMRALALDGKTAFMAVPSNVAANLYNKGAQIKPLNISTWGILFMLSRDKERTKLADYKNEEIVLPFRGDMPDIVFQLIAEKEGLDVKKDFKIRYVSSPLDAMQ
ncbi:MAG TPA: hypothetical protein PLY93_11245, partial [Turneriella sp.]|nr:hypothetical protein [Turneriella sp.]